MPIGVIEPSPPMISSLASSGFQVWPTPPRYTDLTCKLVGWAMAPHMQAELVEGALAMAISRRQPNGGVVHHSDSEYLRAGSLRWSDPNTDRRS